MTERLEIPVEGGTLAAEAAGPDGGPVLVLVHGFPFDHRMWSAQIEALSDRRRVVAYDIRGMGRSPAGDGQHTMELFVDDLLTLLETLGGDRVWACGLSMGGYILLRALERAPDRFRGVVLADTRSAADDNEAKLGRAAAIRALRERGSTAYADEVVERLLGATTLADAPDVVETAREIIRSNDSRGLIGAQLAMLSRTDTTGVLPGLRLPALVVVGEEDSLTPPEVGREMASRIPGGDVAIIPRAGHVSALERPREFNRLLGAFLEGGVGSEGESS